MKKTVLIFLVLLLTKSLQAQNFKAFLNEEGQIVDSLEATHFSIISEIADTAWRVSLFFMDNSPIRITTYSDTTFTVPHGDFALYEKRIPSARSSEPDEAGHYIAIRGRYINGLRDGIWIEYYPTERPSHVTTYKKGLLEGTYYEYYRRSNTVFTEGDYLKNRREGEWRYFDEEGNLLRTEFYKGGRLRKKR